MSIAEQADGILIKILKTINYYLHRAYNKTLAAIHKTYTWYWLASEAQLTKVSKISFLVTIVFAILGFSFSFYFAAISVLSLIVLIACFFRPKDEAEFLKTHYSKESGNENKKKKSSATSFSKSTTNKPSSSSRQSSNGTSTKSSSDKTIQSGGKKPSTQQTISKTTPTKKIDKSADESIESNNCTTPKPRKNLNTLQPTEVSQKNPERGGRRLSDEGITAIKRPSQTSKSVRKPIVLEDDDSALSSSKTSTSGHNAPPTTRKELASSVNKSMAKKSLPHPSKTSN